MRCRYVKTRFQSADRSYCVFVYRTEDSTVPEQAKNQYYRGKGSEFCAVGNNLPDTDTFEVDLSGKWTTGKYGMQFTVENFMEILPQTIDGIKGYLSSGMIKGIGPATAELITDKFGTKTFDIMDKTPRRLLEIKGITEKKLMSIMDSYNSSHCLRDLTAYLAPYKVSDGKIRKIYETYGTDSLNTVKNNPFKMCAIKGFGFLTVDEIARANKCMLNDPLRIEGCIDYCMEKVMQDGHLYEEKNVFIKSVYEQLNHGFMYEVVSKYEIKKVIYKLCEERALILEEGVLYSERNYEEEVITALNIATHIVEAEPENVKVDLLIHEAQRELNILLSEKQVEAVRKAFTYIFTIISGGPGTGKTTLEKVLLFIYEKLGGTNVMLMAPTGKASRRMAESTGVEGASTMHCGLQLTGELSEYEMYVPELKADFIILDEQSMVDMHLEHALFRAVKKGTRIVMIGDVNQIPSVGPGNVFRELIHCGVIPVTILNTIFRQAENSEIAENAERILDCNTSLVYGSDFNFLPAVSDTEASDSIVKIYLDEVAEHGLDNVQVITPYRKTGKACSNYLNEVIRDKVNPLMPGMPTMKVKGTEFRIGDKIMQNKNQEKISNGDTGYIKDIKTDADGYKTAELDFGNDRKVEYSEEEMEMIEFSYAITVHKAQGAEFSVVIMPWLPMFYMMLKRNILYTGITRAKKKMYLIGSKRAIAQAIKNSQVNNRNTRLGERILNCYQEIAGKKKKELPQFEQMAMNL